MKADCLYLCKYISQLLLSHQQCHFVMVIRQQSFSLYFAKRKGGKERERDIERENNVLQSEKLIVGIAKVTQSIRLWPKLT